MCSTVELRAAWFGEEFYNLEMFSPPECMVEPGEAWHGRLTWRLIHR